MSSPTVVEGKLSAADVVLLDVVQLTSSIVRTRRERCKVVTAVTGMARGMTTVEEENDLLAFSSYHCQRISLRQLTGAHDNHLTLNDFIAF
uniref:Uncharacterized protein n=1 Tax=Angiostrongylus cantonensis TaxID=6313 RepID=A0A0K0CVU8_ANGCA